MKAVTWCVACWILAASLARADEAELGQRLYETGVGADGEPVVAVLEAPDGRSPGVELPATALTCASCHGRDGRGRPEGGVSPSDLRWHVLSRPWQATAGNGRRHAPYDERRFVQAVTLGFDPAGTRLEAAMPRYRLSRADAGALISYLKQLGRTESPGVDDDRLAVGVLRPATFGPAQRAALDVLEAWRDVFTRDGGIYGRRIELISVDHSEPRLDAVAWIVLPGGEPPSHIDANSPVLLPTPCGNSCRSICPSCLSVPRPSSEAPSRRWSQLAADRGLSPTHLAEQQQALAAAEILTEAFERAGREIDAARLQLSLMDRGGFGTSLGRVHLRFASRRQD